MKFWLEFFKDKRFSWDFKIANFIMKDSLRNYLAVDCTILKEIQKTDDCTNYSKKRIDKVINDLNILMHK
jgi:hypothetical protein